jgi:hypothetical protein
MLCRRWARQPCSERRPVPAQVGNNYDLEAQGDSGNYVRGLSAPFGWAPYLCTGGRSGPQRLAGLETPKGSSPPGCSGPNPPRTRPLCRRLPHHLRAATQQLQLQPAPLARALASAAPLASLAPAAPNLRPQGQRHLLLRGRRLLQLAPGCGRLHCRLPGLQCQGRLAGAVPGRGHAGQGGALLQRQRPAGHVLDRHT